MLAVSYLPTNDVIARLPLTSKYFNESIVWGPGSRALMWREMVNIDATVYKLLRCAARYDGPDPSLEHFKILLGMGPHYNLEYLFHTVLVFRSSNIACSIVQLLLDAHMDPNAIVCGFQTPLMHASLLGRVDIVKLLLRNGASKTIDATDEWNRTALMLSVFLDHVDVTRILIEAGARKDIRNMHGRSVFSSTRENSKCRRYLCQLYNNR